MYINKIWIKLLVYLLLLLLLLQSLALLLRPLPLLLLLFADDISISCHWIWRLQSITIWHRFHARLVRYQLCGMKISISETDVVSFSRRTSKLIYKNKFYRSFYNPYQLLTTWVYFWIIHFIPIIMLTVYFLSVLNFVGSGSLCNLLLLKCVCIHIVTCLVDWRRRSDC
jgi:hypothetical protein